MKGSAGKRDYKSELGKHIAQVRRDAGFSQSQLANDAEIDLSTLSRLERGQLNFTIETIIKIARALEMEPKELFHF